MTKRIVILLLLSVLMGCLLSAQAGDEVLPYREQDALNAHLPAAVQPLALDLAAFTGEGMADAALLEDGSLLTGGSGAVMFTFQAPQEALYEIEIEYMPGSGSGSSIERNLYLNGMLPFEEAKGLAFSRLWNDANRDYQSISGNQPFPSQVEVPQWRTVRLSDALGYVTEPFRFHVLAGENTLRIESIQDGMFIRSITLIPPSKLPAYRDYLTDALAQGATYANIAPIKVQGEDAALKSSPSFYPVNDRTSSMSEPYHPSYIVLNTIGGTAWNAPGEWLAWDFDVPQDGLYRLAMRYKQSALRGMYAARRLRINGEVPFQEADELRFHHASGFQFRPIGARMDAREDEGYWLYLKKGVNRIELEVALGAMGNVLSDIDLITADLNRLYRDVIAITGTVPDVNRNYQLFSRIPHLRNDLYAFQDRLQNISDRLSALTGEGNERAAGLTRLLVMMDSLTEGEEQMVRHLSSFKESITSMGKSVLDLKDQPLLVDWLMLLGKDTPRIKVNGSFFDNLAHNARAFAGSFTNDYNTVGGQEAIEAATEIDVWISSGRDQFEVIRRLINESFTPETGIRVNLKLIATDVLLPATFTGTGPEVALQIGNTAPVNFAFRGAAQDLREFSDYEEVAARFLPAAMRSYTYEGGVYALPDQMSFPVMFYRKDILDELGLDVPETWTDMIDMIPEFQKGNMDIYLDTNPPQTLGAAVSMGNSRPVNTVFLSRLYQTGGDVYDENGERCLFDTEEANLAFRWWTQFYTQHGFARDIDFITRFRLGETPLGIVDLSTYNSLAVSAPEIRNQWSIARVPGTVQDDGTISHAVPCVTGASMIIKNIADSNGTKEESWEFLKWWTSHDTQIKYAREMEAVLGPSGRYLVSNLDAYREVSWPQDIRHTLDSILSDLRGVPEVPGGYITGRYLNNAFLSVITSYTNPSDVLFENVILINDEITAKRTEFGLSVYQAKGGEAP